MTTGRNDAVRQPSNLRGAIRLIVIDGRRRSQLALLTWMTPEILGIRATAPPAHTRRWYQIVLFRTGTRSMPFDWVNGIILAVLRDT